MVEVDDNAPIELEEASAEDIPKEPWKWVPLPILGKRVRVRYLGQTEVTRIGYLPEMRDFTEMMAEQVMASQKQEGEDSPLNTVDALEQIEIERVKYVTLVAHVCVMGEDGPPRKCQDCEMVHPPSLWTRAQTELLETVDLATIADVAERQEVLRQIVPFSEPTGSDTPQPVDTSGSTPPQTS